MKTLYEEFETIRNQANNYATTLQELAENISAFVRAQEELSDLWQHKAKYHELQKKAYEKENKLTNAADEIKNMNNALVAAEAHQELMLDAYNLLQSVFEDLRK